MSIYKSAREAAVALLAHREHSHLELLQKLEKKEFSPDEIEKALDQLREQGLQSDQRFTEAYTHWRINAGFGPRRIAMELKQRGVSQELIDKYLQPGNRAFWKNRLQLVWQKKFKIKTKEAKEHAKQYRHLMQKGFEPELIHAFLSGKNDENE